MITFIIVVHVVVSLMLIGIVLIQSGKGAGFAAAFGIGGMGQSLFGVQTGTFLTRLTTVLAIVFMVTSLSLAMFMEYSEKSVVERIAEEEEGWEETIPAEESESGLPGDKSGEEGQAEGTSDGEGIQSPPEESRQD